jgi:uncharacterized membrane protein YhaH (DUF805 family)
MILSGPKRLSWWIAILIWIGVMVGVVGFIAYVAPIAALYDVAFWLLAIGFFLLAGAAALIYLFLLKSL